VRKEVGDYNSKEYIYRGQLRMYRLRVGESITDEGKVFYIYQNNELFLNPFPTRSTRTGSGARRIRRFLVWGRGGVEGHR
jgi:hypothetical protein